MTESSHQQLIPQDQRRILSIIAVLLFGQLHALSETHWAFIPPVKPTVPEGAPNAIDAFIQAEHASKNLTPAPPADRRPLIRRAYFDLIGLPPSPVEIAAFIHDTSDLSQASDPRITANAGGGIGSISLATAIPMAATRIMLTPMPIIIATG